MSQTFPSTRLSRPTHAAHAVMVAVLVSLLLAGGCNKPASGEGLASRPVGPVTVTTRHVNLEPIQRSVPIVGTLWGEEDATIAAKVSGRIASIRKDVGDRAQPGEILAQLEIVDYDLAVRQKDLAMRELLAKLDLAEFPEGKFDPAQVPTVRRAKLQADNALDKYNRGKQLHDEDPPLLSDQDFADLKTAWEVARSNYEVELLSSKAILAEAYTRKAELDSARQRLTDATVRAPLPLTDASTQPAQPSVAAPATMPAHDSYAISARMVSVGEYVKEGTSLFRLVDDDPIKLRAFVPEKHASEITVGQKVRVNVEAYPQDFWGEISRVNPQVDPTNRTFQVEAIVPNPQRFLKPGAFAKASVQTRIDPRGIFIPRSALLSFAGVHKVFTIRDGKAAEIVIEPGQQRGELIEAVKGLTGNEQIIVTGLNKLATGVPVVFGEPPPK